MKAELYADPSSLPDGIYELKNGRIIARWSVKLGDGIVSRGWRECDNGRPCSDDEIERVGIKDKCIPGSRAGDIMQRLIKAIDDLMSGVGHAYDVDFANLNESLIDASQFCVQALGKCSRKGEGNDDA